MCGIAMIRLLKPLDYYQKKYGTWEYGLQKMYLLMEKQHNRGQEGAGIATVKLDMPPGEEYISRKRIEGKNVPLPENFIWDICAIAQVGKADCRTFIHFFVDTIGNPGRWFWREILT